MEKQVTIAEFIKIIRCLPEDDPVNNPRKWYKTQKEHWLGWLGEYKGPGANGRKTGIKRDARFAYNHVVCPELLLYLIKAIPLPQAQIESAQKAYKEGSSEMGKSGAIRKAVPWKEIYQAIWGNREKSFSEKVGEVFKQGLKRRARNPAVSDADGNTAGLKPDQTTTVQNRAISIRQPYAEQILLGRKKIEYRSVLTHIRGRVFIYASRTPAVDAFQKLKIEPGSLPTGLLVGTVEIIGCQGGDGEFEWQLANPKRLEPPIKPDCHPQPVWFKPYNKDDGHQ